MPPTPTRAQMSRHPIPAAQQHASDEFVTPAALDSDSKPGQAAGKTMPARGTDAEVDQRTLSCLRSLLSSEEEVIEALKHGSLRRPD